MNTARPAPHKAAGAHHRRIAGHAQLDHILDPYQGKKKLRDGATCPQCGAVIRDGRWTWAAKPELPVSETCPACRRINDHFPAGIVRLHGPFPARRKEEILHLARHQEEIEKAEHPLNRIIGIEEMPGAIEISTTDIHLPRRIGEAVKRAFRGTLAAQFEAEGYFVRLDWAPPER